MSVNYEPAQGRKKNREDYRPGADVEAAGARVEALGAERPGAYTSPNAALAQSALEDYTNRPEFSYDPETEPAYRAYREQYQRAGRAAMEDTMGQAAALTGGYGSTYSQAAGQAAYTGWLDKLADVLPKLYAQARDQYSREGEELLKRYGLLLDLEQRDYDRYADGYDRWLEQYRSAEKSYGDREELDYRRYLELLKFWQDQDNWREEMDLDWAKFLWQQKRGG